jgi:hypothetical protein
VSLLEAKQGWLNPSVGGCQPEAPTHLFLSSDFVEPAFEAQSIIVGDPCFSRENESGRKAQNRATGK